MSHFQRLLFELNKQEEHEKNLAQLEKMQEEINKIDLTKYSPMLLHLISQLSIEQQQKLRKIIYQNLQTDTKFAKKYEAFKPDERGFIRYAFNSSSRRESGLIHSASIKFAEPYKLETLNEFESSNNILLPIELKVYLTCVSSSVYKTHLDYQIIKLNEILKMPTIVEKTPYYYQTKLTDVDYDDPDYNTKLEKLQKEHDTTLVLVLRNCGCGYTDQIILNDGVNVNFGQVWHEKFAGDGVFRKVNESFFDYALQLTSN